MIYQIYPRSFFDSTGDGVGDLAGITHKLDYVADLGVDAVWLSPFFTSPMKDFGYDVSDYRGVDPLFGTLDDFRALLARAHALGLRVLIDQVWSHTSDQHAWFQDSRTSGDADKADWYVWADAKPDGTPPNNWQSVFGGAAWTWDTRRGRYYLHNFLREQPDLNFHTPQVQDAILDVARFWLDLGVDGFRLDVCTLYFHDQQLRDNPVRADGRRTANPFDWQRHVYNVSQPENLAFLARLRALADSFGDICLMGEVFDDEGLTRVLEYTQGEDRLHTAYCFDFLTPQCNAPFLKGVLQQWSEGGGWPTWALGNHDAPRLATRWTQGAPTPEKLQLFAAFQMCLAGTLCLYQGEELGLEQAVIPFDRLQDPEGIAFWPEKPGRDGCRTPMPWSHTARNAGFTSSDEPWLPIPSAHVERAISAQTGANGSILEAYRDLVHWRSATPTIGAGHIALLPSDERVLAFVRKSADGPMVCAFNFSDAEVEQPLADVARASLVRSRGVSMPPSSNSIRLGPWGWGALAMSRESAAPPASRAAS